MSVTNSKDTIERLEAGIGREISRKKELEAELRRIHRELDLCEQSIRRLGAELSREMNMHFRLEAE